MKILRDLSDICIERDFFFGSIRQIILHKDIVYGLLFCLLGWMWYFQSLNKYCINQQVFHCRMETTHLSPLPDKFYIIPFISITSRTSASSVCLRQCLPSVRLISAAYTLELSASWYFCFGWTNSIIERNATHLSCVFQCSLNQRSHCYFKIHRLARRSDSFSTIPPFNLEFVHKTFIVRANATSRKLQMRTLTYKICCSSFYAVQSSFLSCDRRCRCCWRIWINNLWCAWRIAVGEDLV